MQTGIINSENLAQILRGISQKRQSGTLEIVLSETQLHVMFVAGKIVEASYVDRSASLEILQILQHAGYIKEFPGEMTFENYKDIFLWLNERGLEAPLVNENLFRSIVKHRILNVLYNLRLDEPATYNFRMQMPEHDGDFSPAASVGQLLLDRVSLEAEEGRFHNLFPSHAWIVRQELGGLALSVEEKTLYDLIGEGVLMEELARKSMLSRYHLQICLLSLHERAIIETEIGRSSGQELVGALNKNIVSALEVATERPFVEADLRPVKSVKNENIEVAHAKKSIAGNAENLQRKAELQTRSVRRSNRSMTVLNAKLLQNRSVPNIVAFVFIICAALAPLWFWRQLLLSF